MGTAMGRLRLSRSYVGGMGTSAPSTAIGPAAIGRRRARHRCEPREIRRPRPRSPARGAAPDFAPRRRLDLEPDSMATAAVERHPLAQKKTDAAAAPRLALAFEAGRGKC